MNGTVVDKVVINLEGGICTENPLPCEDPIYNIIDFNENLPKNQVQNVDNQYLENAQTSYYIYDITGRFIYKSNRFDTGIKLLKSNNLYILVEIQNNKIVNTKKYIHVE